MRLLRSFFPMCSMKSMSLSLLIFTFICAFSHFWLINHIFSFVDLINSIVSINESPLSQSELLIPDNNTKYILVWDGYYLIFPKKGKCIFPSLNCSFKNCLFTEDENYLDGLDMDFNAVIFNDEKLTSPKKPAHRTRSQLYVFTTIESSYNRPACELYNDEFFNWTFTYRLDSTVRWNYFVVRNKSGSIVAPSLDVQWEYIHDPVSFDIKRVLVKKTKAAAWLVSNCGGDSFRDQYLSILLEHLKYFHLTIDVYGKCTRRRCLNDDCDTMLKDHYYFYMAFENSFSRDYVTEKVLHGYDNYVVPIVYGDANYSRFLPAGSYINARGMHPYNLAYYMNEVLSNHIIYENFFKWTNHYTIDSKPSVYHPLCDFCEALNKETVQATIPKFRVWWNGLNGMKWCLPQAFWNESAAVNIDGSHLFSLDF